MKLIFTAMLLAFGGFFNSIELSSQFDNEHFNETSPTRQYIPAGPPARPRPVITARLVSFPQNNSITMKAGRGTYVPIPAGPIPSLTTQRGYAIAIIQNNGVVRGIYNHEGRRVKLDMINNKYTQIRFPEIPDFPVDYIFQHSNSTVCLLPHPHCYSWQSH